MHLSSKKLLTYFSCLLLVSIGLSGCSNILASSSNTNKANDMTLNWSQINDSVNFFPVYVAKQNGYFKDQGVTVNDHGILQTGPKVAAALESGSIDIAGGVITDVFTIGQKDSSIKVLGALDDSYVVDVVVSKKFEKDTGLTESSPLDEKIKALKGKNIGVTGPNTGTSALLTYLFKQVGLNADKDIQEVSLGSTNAAALAALENNKVDAVSLFSPIGQAAEAAGAGDIFISPDAGDVPSMKNDLHGVFYSKQGNIDAQPKAMAAFIRAIGQAETYIQSNPTGATALLKSYLQLSSSVTTAVYKATAPVWAKSPVVDQSAYNTATNFHLQAGLITIKLNYNDVVASSTISAALKG
jgi:ABC-type nitrate/sulfonate/bicarbonate transport system substrate-binding protein